MTDATAPVSRRGWWWLGWAVLVWVAAAELPVVQTLLPVHRPLMLLLPSLAACALVAWWRGGSAVLMVFALAAATVSIWSVVRLGVSADVLTAAWCLVTTGCFALALLAARSRSFLGRGVVAVLGAVLVSAALIVATPAGPAGFSRIVRSALEERGTTDMNSWRLARSQMSQSNSAPADSATAAVLDQFEVSVASLPETARVVLPSMLALQTLAGLAIAWALFHRFSRTRLGMDLAPLREFRFNDHWIWSVIVGLVLTLMPALEALRPFGVNLLVFFGALYALRGAAVLAWFLRPGRSLLGLLVGAALLLLLRDGAAIALGLVGLGDTWADWRRRIRPAVS